jgi:hypothetical protein
MPPDEMRILLGHEVAHIVRGDRFVVWLQAAVQAWLWWNPLVWWINRRIRVERESCCDDFVLLQGFSEARTYSDLLLKVAERATPRSLPLELMGMTETFRTTRRRLQRIMNPKHRRSVKLSLSALAVLIALALALLPGVRAGKAQDREQPLRQDLKKLKVALLAYHIDNDRYPARLTQLTTPIAYIETLLDPAAPDKRPYNYWVDTSGTACRVLGLGKGAELSLDRKSAAEENRRRYEENMRDLTLQALNTLLENAKKKGGRVFPDEAGVRRRIEAKQFSQGYEIASGQEIRVSVIQVLCGEAHLTAWTGDDIPFFARDMFFAPWVQDHRISYAGQIYFDNNYENLKDLAETFDLKVRQFQAETDVLLIPADVAPRLRKVGGSELENAPLSYLCNSLTDRLAIRIIPDPAVKNLLVPCVDFTMRPVGYRYELDGKVLDRKELLAELARRWNVRFVQSTRTINCCFVYDPKTMTDELAKEECDKIARTVKDRDAFLREIKEIAPETRQERTEAKGAEPSPDLKSATEPPRGGSISPEENRRRAEESERNGTLGTLNKLLENAKKTGGQIIPDEAEVRRRIEAKQFSQGYVTGSGKETSINGIGVPLAGVTPIMAGDFPLFHRNIFFAPGVEERKMRIAGQMVFDNGYGDLKDVTDAFGLKSHQFQAETDVLLIPADVAPELTKANRPGAPDAGSLLFWCNRVTDAIEIHIIPDAAMENLAASRVNFTGYPYQIYKLDGKILDRKGLLNELSRRWNVRLVAGTHAINCLLIYDPKTMTEQQMGEECDKIAREVKDRDAFLHAIKEITPVTMQETAETSGSKTGAPPSQLDKDLEAVRSDIQAAELSERDQQVYDHMDQLRNALWRFYLDNKRFPEQLSQLTTPITYFSSSRSNPSGKIPADPFASDGRPYGYWTDRSGSACRVFSVKEGVGFSVESGLKPGWLFPLSQRLQDQKSREHSLMSLHTCLEQVRDSGARLVPPEAEVRRRIEAGEFVRGKSIRFEETTLREYVDGELFWYPWQEPQVRRGNIFFAPKVGEQKIHVAQLSFDKGQKDLKDLLDALALQSRLFTASANVLVASPHGVVQQEAGTWKGPLDILVYSVATDVVPEPSLKDRYVDYAWLRQRATSAETQGTSDAKQALLAEAARRWGVRFDVRTGELHCIYIYDPKTMNAEQVSEECDRLAVQVRERNASLLGIK